MVGVCILLTLTTLISNVGASRLNGIDEVDANLAPRHPANNDPQSNTPSGLYSDKQRNLFVDTDLNPLFIDTLRNKNSLKNNHENSQSTASTDAISDKQRNHHQNSYPCNIQRIDLRTTGGGEGETGVLPNYPVIYVGWDDRNTFLSLLASRQNLTKSPTGELVCLFCVSVGVFVFCAREQEWVKLAEHRT